MKSALANPKDASHLKRGAAKLVSARRTALHPLSSFEGSWQLRLVSIPIAEPVWKSRWLVKLALRNTMIDPIRLESGHDRGRFIRGTKPDLWEMLLQDVADP